MVHMRAQVQGDRVPPQLEALAQAYANTCPKTHNSRLPPNTGENLAWGYPSLAAAVRGCAASGSDCASAQCTRSPTTRTGMASVGSG